MHVCMSCICMCFRVLCKRFSTTVKTSANATRSTRSLFPNDFIEFVFVVFKTLDIFNILQNTYEGGATWNGMLGNKRMNMIGYGRNEVV